MLDAAKSIVPTAMQLRVQDSTIDNLVEQNAVLKANERLSRVQAERVVEDIPKVRSEAAIRKEELSEAINKAITAKNQTGIWPSLRTAADVGAFLGGRTDDTISPLLGSAKAVIGAKSRRSTQETTHSGGGSTFTERSHGINW